ncbi:hypothetical protein ACFRJ9_21780 [Paenarthrobacter sp. NPDC056912]|uniref:hypothetical protein n=1 Tax=Paenarthrobacter sp. NPDC056912 TaxID=3345965 RepID=UPI0036709E5E
MLPEDRVLEIVPGQRHLELVELPAAVLAQFDVEEILPRGLVMRWSSIGRINIGAAWICASLDSSAVPTGTALITRPAGLSSMDVQVSRDILARTTDAGTRKLRESLAAARGVDVFTGHIGQLTWDDLMSQWENMPAFAGN